ncbi:hypothetical protein KUCAC02_010365, partial [Chaenocephalus aceratus]
PSCGMQTEGVLQPSALHFIRIQLQPAARRERNDETRAKNSCLPGSPLIRHCKHSESQRQAAPVK